MDKKEEKNFEYDLSLNQLLMKSVLWIVISFFVLIGLLFGFAGRIDWERGWIFTLTFFLCIIINLVILFITNPEVIEERSRFHRDAKKWDMVLMSVGSIFIFGTLVVAGLDERNKWSELIGAGWLYLGVFLFVIGDLVILWAMAVNKWFSKLVRIQSERGHKVVTEGPYSYVRHPGYVGWSVMWIACPLILGSLWSFVPAILSVILIVIRTSLEDKTLQSELPGYMEYASKVKYRLIPKIW
jgi:protein-S-isoprenylcysteine O-methyltransferase Ste14